MALRCASVGCCENAGAARPNMTVAINAQIPVTPLDIFIILSTPYCCCWCRSLNRSENFKRPAEEMLSNVIIFAFGTRCKRIVVGHGGKCPGQKSSREQD